MSFQSRFGFTLLLSSICAASALMQSAQTAGQAAKAAETTTPQAIAVSAETQAALIKLGGQLMVAGKAYEYDRQLADEIGPPYGLAELRQSDQLGGRRIYAAWACTCPQGKLGDSRDLGAGDRRHRAHPRASPAAASS